jgi:hypothetical protein
MLATPKSGLLSGAYRALRAVPPSLRRGGSSAEACSRHPGIRPQLWDAESINIAGEKLHRFVPVKNAVLISKAGYTHIKTSAGADIKRMIMVIGMSKP